MDPADVPLPEVYNLANKLSRQVQLFQSLPSALTSWLMSSYPLKQKWLFLVWGSVNLGHYGNAMIVWCPTCVIFLQLSGVFLKNLVRLHLLHLHQTISTVVQYAIQFHTLAELSSNHEKLVASLWEGLTRHVNDELESQDLPAALVDGITLANWIFISLSQRNWMCQSGASAGVHLSKTTFQSLWHLSTMKSSCRWRDSSTLLNNNTGIVTICAYTVAIKVISCSIVQWGLETPVCTAGRRGYCRQIFLFISKILGCFSDSINYLSLLGFMVCR